MYKILEPGTHTLTLEDLGKFTTFTISACGFTSKGCGVPTSQVAQTAEDGMYIGLREARTVGVAVKALVVSE